MSVVIAARRRVSQSDCQSGGGRPRKVVAESGKAGAVWRAERLEKEERGKGNAQRSTSNAQRPSGGVGGAREAGRVECEGERGDGKTRRGRRVPSARRVGRGGGENVGLELARTQDIRSQKFFVTEGTEESRSFTE